MEDGSQYTAILSGSEIEVLIRKLNSYGIGGWHIVDGALCREYIFKSFTDAIQYINRCADVAERVNHHPDWCNSYNKITVRLKTHTCSALTMLDFILAEELDKLAEEY